MVNPKITAKTINTVLTRPSTEKDNLMRMVEITKPEFLI
ncbi:MAG: hypothetical protein ACJA1P_002696, partial [Maribacter sp.]